MPTIAEVFKSEAAKLTSDLVHRGMIRKAIRGYEVVRSNNAARFQDWESARTAAAEIKWESINHLDR